MVAAAAAERKLRHYYKKFILVKHLKYIYIFEMKRERKELHILQHTC